MNINAARQQAKQSGQKTYFTGKACKWGHFSSRRTVSGKCLACEVEDDSARDRTESKLKYRAENIAKVTAYEQAYRAKNAERLRQNRALKYALNRDSARQKNVEYYAQNREKECARASAWKAANPERARAAAITCAAARRARMLKAPGSFSPEQIQELYKAQKGCCAVCRQKLGKKYHRDHHIPLVRGGSNDISNIQLLCAPCNQSKGAKEPVEFMQSRGFLL